MNQKVTLQVLNSTIKIGTNTSGASLQLRGRPWEPQGYGNWNRTTWQRRSVSKREKRQARMRLRHFVLPPRPEIPSDSHVATKVLRELESSQAIKSKRVVDLANRLCCRVAGYTDSCSFCQREFLRHLFCQTPTLMLKLWWAFHRLPHVFFSAAKQRKCSWLLVGSKSNCWLPKPNQTPTKFSAEELQMVVLPSAVLELHA